VSDAPLPTLPADAPIDAGRRTSALTRRLAHLTFHTNFEEERFFLLLSIFIGIFSGLAVVCFRVAIDWSRITLMGPLPHSTAARIIGAPTAVGLLVAILVIHFFPDVRGSGINQTKAALYIYNGYIPFRNAVGKFICSRARHRFWTIPRP
jgi:CIC family chloride channel protein